MGLAAGPVAAQQSQPQVIHPIPSPAAGQAPLEAPTLVFETEPQQYNAAPGDQVAAFTLRVTNVWTNEIVIDSVRASCGCTTASLPANPWRIPPGGSGRVHAQVRLAGKMGLVTKTLSFYTSVGIRVVSLKVNIPPPADAGKLTAEERHKMVMAQAAANPQAIFAGECAKCHAEKGRNAYGQELYAADCGICHEASHRESIVPDLHALRQPTDLDYWKRIITLGKPHTLMPAFSAAHGGPLSEAQIISLASYLNRVISHNFSTVMTSGATSPPIHASARP
jgi:mono/diheme cytochrome c family protein